MIKRAVRHAPFLILLAGCKQSQLKQKKEPVPQPTSINVPTGDLAIDNAPAITITQKLGQSLHIVDSSHNAVVDQMEYGSGNFELTLTNAKGKIATCTVIGTDPMVVRYSIEGFEPKLKTSPVAAYIIHDAMLKPPQKLAERNESLSLHNAISGMIAETSGCGGSINQKAKKQLRMFFVKRHKYENVKMHSSR